MTPVSKANRDRTNAQIFKGVNPGTSSNSRLQIQQQIAETQRFLQQQMADQEALEAEFQLQEQAEVERANLLAAEQQLSVEREQQLAYEHQQRQLALDQEREHEQAFIALKAERLERERVNQFQREREMREAHEMRELHAHHTSSHSSQQSSNTQILEEEQIKIQDAKLESFKSHFETSLCKSHETMAEISTSVSATQQAMALQISQAQEQIFFHHKRPRSVDTPDMVKLRDMKLQSHHLVVVGGGAYVGTIMHVYP